MAYRDHGSTHPKVTFPSPREIFLGPASKWLSPFTDGASGIRYQVLKIFSKSLFFREANKG
jgi:hypothetical protein